jgi:hypothetical protein
MKSKLTRVGVILGTLASASSVAHAQTANVQADARDYEVLNYFPNNTLALIAYARHVSTSAESSFSQDVGVLRAAYILKFGNLAVVPFDATMPIVDATVYVPMTVLHTSGVGDLTYQPTIAYLIDEDTESHTHTHIALTGYITAPTGNYDSAQPVNIGDHRWRFQPQLAVGQRFLKRMTLEASGGAVVYTNNSDAFTGMAPLPLKQDVSFDAEAHIAGDLSPTSFIAASYYFLSEGARNLVLPTGGTASADPSQTVQTLRFTYGIHIEKQSLLLIQYNQDIEETGGATISRFFGARFSHVMFF